MTPLFVILNADATVKSLLGTSPLRVYPWGEAPENAVRPYATYGVFNGLPENYMDRVPDVDTMGTQIDIWAETPTSCEACFTAIRNAIEPHAHMTSFEGNERDDETKLYRARMDIDFIEGR